MAQSPTSSPSGRPSAAPSISFQPTKSQQPSGAPSSSLRPTLEGCNVEYGNKTVVSAQEFADASNNSVVYDATEDALICGCRSFGVCDCQNTIIRNCEKVSCFNRSACTDVDFRDNAFVDCGNSPDGYQGNNCLDLKISNSQKVFCGASYGCGYGIFEDIGELRCLGYACLESDFVNVQNLTCEDRNGCEESNFTNIDEMRCDGDDSCANSEISNVKVLQCGGRRSCYRSNITGVFERLVCSDQNSCEETDVTEIADNVPVECIEIGACNNARRLEKNASATGENITVACHAQSACLNVTSIDIGLGSVSCEGEYQFPFQACTNVSIRAQCLACLDDMACGQGCQFQSDGSSSPTSCNQDSCDFFGTCSDTTCTPSPTTSGAFSLFQHCSGLTGMGAILLLTSFAAMW